MVVVCYASVLEIVWVIEMSSDINMVMFRVV